MVTSARFYYLSEMFFEVAGYPVGYDDLSMERLRNAGTLLEALGKKKPSWRAKQPSSPNLRGWSRDARAGLMVRAADSFAAVQC